MFLLLYIEEPLRMTDSSWQYRRAVIQPEFFNTASSCRREEFRNLKVLPAQVSLESLEEQVLPELVCLHLHREGIEQNLGSCQWIPRLYSSAS
jgi:hypothetical protein